MTKIRRFQTKDGVITWKGNPKQHAFCEYYLNPVNVETFANAYQSAVKAGYSESYAKLITAPAINNHWIQEYKRAREMQQAHITQGIQHEAIYAQKSSDRLRAYELLARLNGLLVDKSITAHVNIEQAIQQLK